MKTKPYIEIIHDDITKTRKIESRSIDLIITSPPYGLDIKYANYNDDITYDKYLEFTENWLRKCYELAKSDGRMCVNILLDRKKDGSKNIYADFLGIAKTIGWKYYTTVIWNKGHVSRRSAFGSWMSASAPCVIAPVEMIAILYKETWKKSERGESDITRQEFIDWTNGFWELNEKEGEIEGAEYPPVWRFAGESRKRVNHPVPFPVELPRRCIKLFSYKGNLILDPFMGSGTTLVACKQTGRRGIGVDISTKYCKVARERLKALSSGVKAN